MLWERQRQKDVPIHTVFREKVEPLDVYWAGTVIAFEMFRDCQMLYAVHTGMENIHIHFVFSPVKADGRKCDYSGRKFTEMKNQT